MGGILFIEDDAAARELGTYNLRKAGYQVDAAASGEEGLEALDPDRHHVVITDLRMPGITGMQVLAAVKRRAADLPVVVVTAYASIDRAVAAMKAGASDFIGKPFKCEELLMTVARVLERRALRAEAQELRTSLERGERPMVCASPAMRELLAVADRVAPTNASVLITGESGTGKELVARRIHARSARASGPLVAVNCAALPPRLIDSELFGHHKGAFTGAAGARKGRFRQADGGTIFLDEVAELPIELQGKLLRVLQEQLVDAVGADTPVKVDVRVLAATNKQLGVAVERGTFRNDLYYRLDVVEIALPPLRAQPEQIEPLVRHFVALYGGGRELLIGDELLAAMRQRAWPGNVRELQNACERLVILCSGGRLRVEDLPPEQDAAASRPDPSDLTRWPPLPPGGLGLVDLEKRVIEQVLAAHDGNITHAAAYLKVPRHILSYRMSKYGLR